MKKAAKPSKGFTAEEKSAMRDRAKEMKAGDAGGEADVLAKIAELKEPERGMAERLHKLLMATSPELTPKTWYGMPAYAKDDKVVCHFQSAGKFKTRYATLGFSDKAKLDDGEFWPVAFALKELTPAVEKKIAELVKRALG